jgi:Type ISP C-terminal specificity domain
MAHPSFTARFKADLVRPGLCLPLTADKTLFDDAIAVGREVVWLHCYGERFVDAAADRPKGPPRLLDRIAAGPLVVVAGAVQESGTTADQPSQ